MRGKLRHRVIIQARTDTANAYGEKVPSWATWRTPWVNISLANPSERVNSERATETGNVVITLDYLSGLTADHRILYGSRVFHIHGIVNVDERNREMVLSCSEVR